MALQYPHLSLSRIHAALAHYYDHQPECDRAIARELEAWDAQASQFKDSPIRRKLRALGKSVERGALHWTCMCAGR